MALKIRLRQQGRKNQQTYRIVVMDIRSKRDGRYLEKLGWYDPSQEGVNYAVNGERVHFWLEHGAELSPSAEQLIRKGAPTVFQGLVAKQERRRLKQAQKRRAQKKKTGAKLGAV